MSDEVKYYYSDPLAAAWMAKHFEMVYTDETLVDNEAAAMSCPRLTLHSVSVISPREMTLTLSSNKNDRYYICADSLHLLEPRNGDIGISSRQHGTVYKFGDDYNPTQWRTDCNHYLKPDHDDEIKIIMRRRVAFIWPEKE